MTDLHDIHDRLQEAGLGAFTGAPVCHLYSAVVARAHVGIYADQLIAYDPDGHETARVDIRPEWTTASVVRQAMDMAGHTWEPGVTCQRCGQLVDPADGHDDLSGPCVAPEPDDVGHVYSREEALAEALACGYAVPTAAA